MYRVAARKRSCQWQECERFRDCYRLRIVQATSRAEVSGGKNVFSSHSDSLQTAHTFTQSSPSSLPQTFLTHLTDRYSLFHYFAFVGIRIPNLRYGVGMNIPNAIHVEIIHATQMNLAVYIHG